MHVLRVRVYPLQPPPQPSCSAPTKRRAGLDPASAAGYVVLAWVPGRAREDEGKSLSLNITPILTVVRDFPKRRADLESVSAAGGSLSIKRL